MGNLAYTDPIGEALDTPKHHIRPFGLNMHFFRKPPDRPATTVRSGVAHI